MAVKEIKIYGETCLKQICVPVEDFGVEEKNLAQDMIQTMYAVRGIGLAAPQVGVLKRIIVLDVEQLKGKFQPIVLFDPEVLPLTKSGDGSPRGANYTFEEEGCLSIPGIREKVKRADRIIVRAWDLDGKSVQLKTRNLMSRVILHEIDHLDGILFVERVDFFRRLFLRPKLKKIKKEAGG